jgi:hypothetical protein
MDAASDDQSQRSVPGSSRREVNSRFTTAETQTATDWTGRVRRENSASTRLINSC